MEQVPLFQYSCWESTHMLKGIDGMTKKELINVGCQSRRRVVDCVGR
jgi:hypothetical protein